VVVGLDLNDQSADTIEQERRADEIGGDVVNAAVKKTATETCPSNDCGWH
jgi:hypothetical protein